jgi:hypothetical protein
MLLAKMISLHLAESNVRHSIRAVKIAPVGTGSCQ